MRWEGFFEREVTPGRFMKQSIDSWDTMTDCLKHGFEIRQESGWSWLACALPPRRLPEPGSRAKKRT